jgi:uridine kinase
VKEVLAAIHAAPPRAGATRVLAIDGRSGAGKSTFAAALARTLDAPLVSLEDLYGGWDGLWHGVALLCDAVLEPLAAGVAASVPRYDWEAREWAAPRTLEAPPILVVEGVGAGSLRAAPYTSVLVWLECDEQRRRERVRARRAGDLQQWVRWAAREQDYINAERPQQRADLVIAAPG